MTDYGTTLLLLRIARIVLLIALMSLAGQGIVYALSRASGADPERNVFYKLLEAIASPFVRLVRLVTPKLVLDRHVPWATFGLLLFAFFFTLWAIAQTCLSGLGLPLRECLGAS